ncbi:MAG: hypothetical protein ACLT2T_03440 [Bilophila wadsworthia]
MPFPAVLGNVTQADFTFPEDSHAHDHPPYRYTHASTESMTGYFSCEPPEDLCFEDALARLEAAPLDEFLHRHLLRRIAALPPDEAAALRTPSRPVLMGLLCETAFLNAGHAGMLNGVSAGELERLEGATPLPYLSFARKSLTKEGQEEQANLAAWNALFEENLSGTIPCRIPTTTISLCPRMCGTRSRPNTDARRRRFTPSGPFPDSPSGPAPRPSIRRRKRWPRWPPAA